MKMQTKYNTFETTYKKARTYALVVLAGPRLADQFKYKTDTFEFERKVYLRFAEETQVAFYGSLAQEIGRINRPDSAALAKERRLLRELFKGKRSLKALCYIYYLQAEGAFLAAQDDST
jgi:hypothetical protein